jgi:hypothetical protein
MASSDTEARCACCFRILRLGVDYWTWFPQPLLLAVVHHDHAPYADILSNTWASAHELRVCDGCNQFLLRRTRDARVRPGRYHAMHQTIAFLLSGGVTPSPPRPTLDRCLDLLAVDNNHPFLTIEGLRERFIARRRVQNADHVVRWLLAGRPQVFCDLVWGKRVRKWHHSPMYYDIMAGIEDVSACRLCSLSASSSSTTTSATVATSYQGALTFGTDTIEARLRECEGNLLVPGETDMEDAARIARWTRVCESLLFFCPACRRLGVISHAYHLALWPRLGLTPFTAADTYYSHMIERIEKKKEMLARGLVVVAAIVLPPSPVSSSDNNNNNNNDESD